MSSLFAVPSPARARAALLGFAIALLLCGCQAGSASGPSPSPSQTGSTTASPTSSATPSVSASAGPGSAAPAVYKPADAKGKAENVPVPVMPELAKENSKEGLEAFIRYWYATYSYATETGDLEPWIAATDTTTESGAAYTRAIELNYISGRWVTGGRITTPVVEVLWDSGADSQVAKVQVIQEEIRYFDADGGVRRQPSVESNAAEAVKATFADGFWQVIDNGLILG